MTHDCWWHQERIEQAQRENDQKTLDFYRRFSNKPNPSNGIKAMAENCADYEQFLACGFTDEYETKVNEYGWFEHEIRPLEDIMVYNEPKFGQARIRLAQLPNGAEVTVERVEDGWARITWQNEGYVMADYLRNGGD
jgi:hypothetical protein